jgi:hypothetical protein
LCQTHAKAIDDDELRFTKELLIAWRRHAEEIAAEELGRPLHENSYSRLIPHRVQIGSELTSDLALLHEAVEHFLMDIGATRSWANHYETVRMTLYELSLNAMRHGGAATVDLDSSDGRVCLRDGGTRFGLAGALEEGSWGTSGHTAPSGWLR